MKYDGWQIPLFALLALAFFAAFSAYPPKGAEGAAAWVQAVGSVGAILAAVWVSAKQYRDTRELEAQRAADAAAKELAETVAFVQAIREELKTVWFGYRSDTRRRLWAVRDHEFLNHIYNVSSDAFTIYNGSSARVGKVSDAELRRLIVVVYAQAKGLVSSYQHNNELVREFRDLDQSSATRDVGRALSKRRELIESIYTLKERDIAIRRDLRLLSIRMGRWLRANAADCN